MEKNPLKTDISSDEIFVISLKVKEQAFLWTFPTFLNLPFSQKIPAQIFVTISRDIFSKIYLHCVSLGGLLKEYEKKSDKNRNGNILDR